VGNDTSISTNPPVTLSPTPATSSPTPAAIPTQPSGGLQFPDSGNSGGLPFPSNTLVLDGGTIYYISGQIKIPFTSMKAFLGLGYSLTNVVSGDTSAYSLPQSFLLNSPTQEHPWGSWLAKGKTVYYFTDQGFIPIPSLSMFASNGGQLKYIINMSKTELIFLPQQTLPIMINNDSRVGL
jgi:hypothetical protein